MRRRRVPLALVWPAALLLLVGILATLQYRWLGEVSAAERAGMQTSLRAHADDFARDFDREIAVVYATLQTEGGALEAEDWPSFATRFDQWKSSARYPQLVRDVYFVHGPEHQLMRFDAASRAFVTAPWPPELESIRGRFAPPQPIEAGTVRLMSKTFDAVVPKIPAIVVTLPTAPVMTFAGASLSTGPSRPTTGTSFATGTSLGVSTTFMAKRELEEAQTRAIAQRLMSFQVTSDYAIAMLDRDYIQGIVLPDLATRYFPEVVTENSRAILARSEGYRLAVLPDDDLAHPVYARGLAANTTIEPKRADADVPLFALRPDLFEQVLTSDRKSVYSYTSRAGDPHATKGTAPETKTPLTARGQLSIVFAATPRGDVNKTTGSGGAAASAWQLVLQHSAGSLDAAVGQGRLRNLTLSFGVLALLAASVGLIAINAQRAQRLALQQMDFVATVSHELRTPLAVIRSAAQNLSAGVIHDAAQAKRYGDLIDAEGKRLTDMVEQVLEFAGLAGNRRPPAARAIDAVSLVNDVVASCASLLESERFTVDVRAAAAVPPVAADDAALRRALNNLISNAVKYAAEGRWIGIVIDHAAGRGAGEVQIAVSDHGQGIDAQDLPHIFEPFYRGRYATERQIHGNGLGLSLVKRIADAHGGRVTVKSAPGEGTTFTLHLPAATPDPAMSGLAAPEAHGTASA